MSSDTDEPSVFCGGPPCPPTPEEVAAFELAMNEANARFLAAAMAEDGMPISALGRGPETIPTHPPVVSDIHE